MSEHVLDRLSAFLDEELPAREQEAVEGHVRACTACAAHLDRLRGVDAGARALTVSAPEGYFDALPGRIRARLEKSPRRAPRLPVWSWAVAAALLLAVVTPITLNRYASPRSEPSAPYRVAEEAARAIVPTVAPPAAGKDLGVLDQRSSGAPRSEAKERDQAADRDDRPVAAAPAATVPAVPYAKTEAPKLQDARAPEREAPAPRAPAPRQRSGPGGPYAQQQAPQAQSGATFAEAPVEAPAAAPAEGARLAESNEVSRDESLLKGDDQGAARDKAVGGVALGRVSSVASSDEKVFRVLQGAAAPTTLAALRERREAWRSFTQDFPSSPRTDEARVRVVETGIEAWRKGGESADLDRAREDAAVYLARRDAVQAARVRALLESLPSPR